MRGKFLSILASVLCVGEIAMAAVPLNSIALGGIVPGMTKGDVERIYGSCKILHPYQYSPKSKTYFGVIGLVIQLLYLWGEVVRLIRQK